MEVKHAAFVHSPQLEQYSYPPECPFSTARAGLTRKAVASMGLLTGESRREVAPRQPRRAELLGFHTDRYLHVLAEAPRGHLDAEGLAMGLGTAETPIFRGLYEYATLAAGATLTAADLLLDGQATLAFNPSGGYHHAHPEQASGFCYINDVAIGCQHLAAAGKRVMFLDIDAHHCDGVQEAFFARRDVMTVSFHESGKTLFPGTGFEDEIGVGEGRGYAANVPMPAGLYDDAFLKAFRAVALPLIDAFDPDVIVMELGMDCLAGDPLTHLSLTNNAYADAIRLVVRSGKPILATGGGGYNVQNSVRGWALAWSVLCDEDTDADEMIVGLGGVMMATTDWLGGLRDRLLAPSDAQRRDVDLQLDATIAKVKANVFAYHGL